RREQAILVTPLHSKLQRVIARILALVVGQNIAVVRIGTHRLRTAAGFLHRLNRDNVPFLIHVDMVALAAGVGERQKGAVRQLALDIEIPLLEIADARVGILAVMRESLSVRAWNDRRRLRDDHRRIDSIALDSEALIRGKAVEGGGSAARQWDVEDPEVR